MKQNNHKAPEVKLKARECDVIKEREDVERCQYRSNLYVERRCSSRSAEKIARDSRIRNYSAPTSDGYRRIGHSLSTRVVTVF